jgi:uncharacterized membrane protein
MVYFMALFICRCCSWFIALFGLAIETAMLITIYLNEAMIKMVENMEIAVKQLQRRYYEIILFMALLRGC